MNYSQKGEKLYTYKKSKKLYFGIFSSKALLKHLHHILCLPDQQKSELNTSMIGDSDIQGKKLALLSSVSLK